ncbi:hypothetical protein [Novosphingobium sp. ST904]|uniref:hypothetical protein n=1 Tax=Novosphingobium sp. ST904 TaxID=1684385 RepID=UPI0006C83DB8|nr:hypothetical protein [Novosphingobium sp. ST904]KPH62310.1 hypothetical protein ADT71_15320 [Novosphingobium sp. ST904]TCM43353.1 hypothetical protein EDF59_101457 [Novosphingobium sp. ST904]
MKSTIHPSDCPCLRCAPRHPAARRPLSPAKSLALHAFIAAIAAMGLLAMAIGITAHFVWNGL